MLIVATLIKSIICTLNAHFDFPEGNTALAIRKNKKQNKKRKKLYHSDDKFLFFQVSELLIPRKSVFQSHQRSLDLDNFPLG